MSVQVRPVAPDVMHMSNFEIHEHVRGLYSSKLSLDNSKIFKSSMMVGEIVLANYAKDESNEFESRFNQECTMTSVLHRNYNLFLYPLPQLHELYFEIQRVFHSCLARYSGITNKRYYIQCWVNIFQNNEFIDWHTHFHPNVNAWHGFYCVNVEPDSFTSYRWPNHEEIIDIKSENGLVVLGVSGGDRHKSSKWNQETPRVTIAFDILPQESLMHERAIEEIGKDKIIKEVFCKPEYINHWVPI